MKVYIYKFIKSIVIFYFLFLLVTLLNVVFFNLWALLKVILINMVFFIDIDFLKTVPSVLPIMFSVAFFTLLESKVLGGVQRRRGPNIVGMWGVGQAFADAGKLLAKESMIPSSSNFIIFILAPIITFILSLLNWAVIPFNDTTVMVDLNIGVLFIFAMSSLSVHGIIMAGWASNSRYAFLGCLRAAAQMISYEVTLVLTVMPVFLLAGSLNLLDIVEAQEGMWFIMPLFPCFLMFFVAALVETNSAPFDLPEAESELVSGYNVEYSSITFALFFLAEYSNILVISILIVMFFLGGWLAPFGMMALNGWLWFTLKLFMIMYMFMLIRGMVPSYKYNELMDIGWKMLLPTSLAYLFFMSVVYSLFLLLI